MWASVEDKWKAPLRIIVKRVCDLWGQFSVTANVLKFHSLSYYLREIAYTNKEA